MAMSSMTTTIDCHINKVEKLEQHIAQFRQMVTQGLTGSTKHTTIHMPLANCTVYPAPLPIDDTCPCTTYTPMLLSESPNATTHAFIPIA